MTSTGKQLLTDAEFYYQLSHSSLISVGKRCSWYMNVFFYNNYFCNFVKVYWLWPYKVVPLKLTESYKIRWWRGVKNVTYFTMTFMERLFPSKGKFCIQETSIVTHPQRDAMLRYYDLYWVLQLLRHRIACGRQCCPQTRFLLKWLLKLETMSYLTF